mmetsp:Transcript_848/g.1639  ORF Transcript_848/g.1639 Transcript_848/m.1639 type:complete len:755 (-) Transcript_848:738-3002(-)
MMMVVKGHDSPTKQRQQIAPISVKKAPLIITRSFIIFGSALFIVLFFQVILASTFIVYEGGDVFDPSNRNGFSGLVEEPQRKLDRKTETPMASPIPPFATSDGQLLFNPEEFRTGDKSKYFNRPIPCSQCDEKAKQAIARQVQTPTDLVHKPEANKGNDAVISLMPVSYMVTRDQKRFISSLRQTGYNGHIILGVQPNLPVMNMRFLKIHHVTIYTVTLGPCTAPISGFKTLKAKTPKCFKGLESLPFEWGKYELARQWLHACNECTGRVLLALDGVSTFFQTNPFEQFLERKEDLLFSEELAAHTNPFYYDPDKSDVRHGSLFSKNYASMFKRCYPKLQTEDVGSNRPLLVPTTVLGTYEGIYRYLSVMSLEFESKIEGTSCHYPAISEAGVVNYLYYTGAFGSSMSCATLPWGAGFLQDLEKPCRNQYLDSGNSKSQLDMVRFDFNETGFIANRYEISADGLYRPAPILHNYDNCDKWVKAYLKIHGELTGQIMEKPPDYLEILEHTILNSVVDRSDIAGGEELNPMKTSYQRSTVVQQAPWFPAERKCKKRCCAQAIAIALEPDKDHLITSVDGLDLGDVSVLGHGRKGFLQWAISDLNFDIIPCLQKGTIVYADHEGGGAKRFFDIYRPRMTEPYLLITGGSDGMEPLKPKGQGREILQTDNLLIGWYGINPCYECGADHPKFHMMHLGLSALYDHQKFLAARLNQRGFDNPFSDAKKRRWTESTELASADDATRLVFVKFGINAHSQHR